MTIYEYRPRNFGATPTPAFAIPPNAGTPAALVGGETALDTSDGYASWTRLTADGDILDATTFEGHVFTFEPVGALAPTSGITRVWWEMDFKYDANPTSNGVLMWGHLGSGYQQLFGAGGFDARNFGDVEAQDLPVPFLVYVSALLSSTFILGCADPGYTNSSVVDVTRLTMLIEVGGTTYLRNHARDDGLGGNAPRNLQVTSQQRSLRNKSYR